MAFLNRLFVCLQYCVPQHSVSRLLGWLADCRVAWLKTLLIRGFVNIYNVNVEEAEAPVEDYPSFNAFFVRALKADARPLCEETDAVACPVDGTVNQAGEISSGKLVQAKGRYYDLTTLLGGSDYLAQPFFGGKFSTIYLAPKDYHRVHMPLDGQLQTMVHVPGRLFSVNNTTAQLVPNLFARNERVIGFFDTSVGPMAVILIGAMIVAGIETVWAGQVTPVKRQVQTIHYPNTIDTVALSKGDEMGHFKFGSTVIVLFGPDAVSWSNKLEMGQRVKMGEEIGRLINA